MEKGLIVPEMPFPLVFHPMGEELNVGQPEECESEEKPGKVTTPAH